MRKSVPIIISSVLAYGFFMPGAGAQQLGANTGSIGTLGGVPAPSANAAAQIPGQAAASPGGASAQPLPQSLIQQDSKPVAFRDPKRGFIVAAPPGARFDQRGEKGQVLIQSRKGYGLSIQAGDANPNATTHDMFARLESKYLGDSKPWSKKSSEDQAVIGGLNAGTAIYEAGASRTQVIIARGAKTDFVFMFFAPISRFEELSSELQWILTSFRPADGEVIEGADVVEAKQIKQQKEPEIRAESVPTPIASRPKEIATAPSNPDIKVFSESGYGYQVAYPTHWNLEKMSAFTNVISGRKGTAAYDAMVTMQNVKPGSGDGDAAESAFTSLKTNLSTQAKNVAFVGEKPVTYNKDGLTLTGRQFVANYEHAGRSFRKWALVLPRPEGEVAHIWSYTAPMETFETYRPIAEGILNSLKIDASRG